MFRKALSVLKVSTILAAAAVALFQFQGCGGSSNSTEPKGTLKLSITDKMSDDFKNVVISIREIRVVPAGRENAPDNDPGLPVVVSFETPKVIDVMQLRFVQQALGDVLLPAGSYSQIRLILEPNPNGQGQDPANYLVLNSDSANTKIPLTTPSGQTSGLKVLGPLDIKAGIINAVMIDFDPNTAIVPRGNGDYNLKPTGIRLVRMAEMLTQYGSISGIVSTFDSWSSAAVSVKRRGTVNDIDPIAAGRIFANYTSGTWQAPFAAFVPPSSPAISYKTFITANGFRLYSSAAVGVLQGQTTDLGTISLVKAP
ncbi:MAG: DUF4382 domain-containing protein [Desulfuromonadaceae bacterium]